MPRRDFTNPPPPRPPLDMTVARWQLFAFRHQFTSKLAETEPAAAQFLRDFLHIPEDERGAARDLELRILERMHLLNLEQRIAIYDSCRHNEIEGLYTQGNLIYLRGDIIKVLARANNQWALGVRRNYIGVFPLGHTTPGPFLRVLQDYTATSATELSVAQGHVLPVFPSNDSTRFTAFRGDQSGLVPATHLVPDQTPSRAERLRNSQNYYQYSPLAEGEIRLLCVTTVNVRDFLECDRETMFFDIMHVPIGQASQYTAFSYCWGDPSDKKTIFCNGKFLDIPIKLWLALRYDYPSGGRERRDFSPVFGLPYNEGPPQPLPPRAILDETAIGARGNAIGARGNAKFWADAACINQEDTLEKNKQIPFMDNIYRRATLVLAFVDETESSLTTALLMNLVETGVNESPEWAVIPQATVSHRLDRVDWPRLKEFFSNQFFRRSWIIQEIVLGTRVQFRFGPALLTLDQLNKYTRAVRSRNVQTVGSRLAMAANEERDEDGYNEGVSQLHNLSKIKSSLPLAPPSGFIEILQSFRAAKATDPRDKVYSLLSLAPPQYRSQIIPDYSLANTTANVFRELAVCAAGTTEVGRLLLNAGTSRVMTGLPSWTPDWSLEPRHALDPALYACTGRAGVTHATLSGSDRDKLTMRGAVVDTIINTGPRWTPRKDVEFPDGPGATPVTGTVPCCIRVVGHLCHAARQALQATGPPDQLQLSNDDCHEAVWQTLVCGCGWGERRSIPDDRRHYGAFLDRHGYAFGFHDQQAVAARDQTQLEEDMYPFITVMSRFQDGRRTCVTQKSRLGAVPDDAQDGDVIAIFLGVSVPVVLRRMNGGLGGGSNEYTLIGHCHVHGIMDGELVDAVEGTAEPGVQGSTVVDITLV